VRAQGQLQLRMISIMIREQSSLFDYYIYEKSKASCGLSLVLNQVNSLLLEYTLNVTSCDLWFTPYHRRG
jgi:hypothetical protein